MKRRSATIASMLNLWRRHTPNCKHRKKGRNHVGCNCPIWVDGTLHGKRFRRSAGGRDWQRALRKVATWESPAGKTLKALPEAIESFLIHTQDLAYGTRRNYRNVLRLMGSFCRSEAFTHTAELTVEALDRYRASRNIARSTQVKELQILRQFCGFCFERGWITENPAKRVKLPANVKPSPVEPYTSTEVGRLLFACDRFGRAPYERLRARAMILLLRHTGLRISDVATLARERIQDGQIFLHTLKTGGQVLLPLPAELIAALDVLPLPKDAEPDCPYFFWNGVMGERAVIRNARRTLSAVFRYAKVPRARTHRFRHTMATDILVKGGTEQDVADVLGISPAIVRDHYAKWTPQRQQRISAIMRMVQAGTAVEPPQAETGIVQ